MWFLVPVGARNTQTVLGSTTQLQNKMLNKSQQAQLDTTGIAHQNMQQTSTKQGRTKALRKTGKWRFRKSQIDGKVVHPFWKGSTLEVETTTVPEHHDETLHIFWLLSAFTPQVYRQAFMAQERRTWHGSKSHKTLFEEVRQHLGQ